MKRRKAIKQIFIVAGGLALLPSCLREKGGASIVLNHIRVSSDQENMLAALVEALIPETDSPGATSLNLHLFVLKMVDDCHSPDDQKAFIEGLEKLGIEQDHVAGFWGNKPEQDNAVFAHIVRRRTIQGYLNSEYVMKNKLVYELAPGKYDGAVQIEA